MHGTLRCTCPSDIYLLLKSSDSIAHDLHHPYDLCSDAEPSDNNDDNNHTASPSVSKYAENYVLVLREWYDLAQEREYRCFVADGTLIGKLPYDFYASLL